MKNGLKKSYFKDNSIISDVDNGLVFDLNNKNGIGSVITPSIKILSIVNLDKLVIEANVDEQFIKDIKIGKNVSILPEYDKEKKLTGKVKSISSSAIQINGETTIPVIISLDKKDDSLMLNFNVQVTIDVV
jgi:multidrug resistance efflux pump